MSEPYCNNHGEPMRSTSSTQRHVSDCHEQINRLTADNAKLLEALESVLSRGCMLRRVDELEGEYVLVPHPETMEEIKAAIEKAQQ